MTHSASRTFEEQKNTLPLYIRKQSSRFALTSSLTTEESLGEQQRQTKTKQQSFPLHITAEGRERGESAAEGHRRRGVAGWKQHAGNIK